MSPILFKQIIDHLFKIGIVGKNFNVGLYNWGEPFLNPKINDILRILKNRKLRARISSNFIVRPDIDKELLPVISRLTFSLSGFSQESYGRIHGASLDKVLDNFESLYADLREYSPGTKTKISWHRYLFNENEFWNMRKYFNKRPALYVAPVIAYFNDLTEMMEFSKGKLSRQRLEEAEKDIFLDRIRKGINYHKKQSKNYYCPQWDSLVIDESGQVLRCCTLTRYDSDHVFGNVLEMSAEELWNIKDPICNECISSGLARFIHFAEKPIYPLPSGGGLYGLKIKFPYSYKRFLFQCKYILVRILKQFPLGGKIINVIKNLR